MAKLPKVPTAPTPKGLQSDGEKLWLSVVTDYELDPHELALLESACRVADSMTRLAETAAAAGVTTINSRGDVQVHPAMVEYRMQSIALTRLIASLRLPSGDESDMSRPQRRGSARGSYGTLGIAK